MPKKIEWKGVAERLQCKVLHKSNGDVKLHSFVQDGLRTREYIARELGIHVRHVFRESNNEHVISGSGFSY